MDRLPDLAGRAARAGYARPARMCDADRAAAKPEITGGAKTAGGALMPGSVRTDVHKPRVLHDQRGLLSCLHRTYTTATPNFQSIA
jgi:hypothetical protein